MNDNLGNWKKRAEPYCGQNDGKTAGPADDQHRSRRTPPPQSSGIDWLGNGILRLEYTKKSIAFAKHAAIRRRFPQKTNLGTPQSPIKRTRAIP